jgi:integrase
MRNQGCVECAKAIVRPRRSGIDTSRTCVARAPVALVGGELRQLLETARKHSLRNHLMWVLGATHGLRVSEIIALKKKNFSVTSNEVLYLTVQRLKGSRHVCVICSRCLRRYTSLPLN